ncbi:MAG: hypothetical protein V1855_04945 [bacterium]
MAGRETDDLSRIETLLLFLKLNDHLILLLKSLNKNEWDSSTVLPGRTVKDLASHILDGSLRRLSQARDSYQINTSKVTEKELRHI